MEVINKYRDDFIKQRLTLNQWMIHHIDNLQRQRVSKPQSADSQREQETFSSCAELMRFQLEKFPVETFCFTAITLVRKWFPRVRISFWTIWLEAKVKRRWQNWALETYLSQFQAFTIENFWFIVKSWLECFWSDTPFGNFALLIKFSNLFEKVFSAQIENVSSTMERRLSGGNFFDFHVENVKS